MRKIYGLITMCMMLLMAPLQAQGAEEVLRGNAKHNTVIAVLVIIFLGLMIYLIRLDRKINKLDK
jgi:CcmD family protein